MRGSIIFLLLSLLILCAGGVTPGQAQRHHLVKRANGTTSGVAAGCVVCDDTALPQACPTCSSDQICVLVARTCSSCAVNTCRSSSLVSTTPGNASGQQATSGGSSGSSSSTVPIIVAAVCGTLLIVSAIGGFVWWKRRRARDAQEDSEWRKERGPAPPPPAAHSMDPVPGRLGDPMVPQTSAMAPQTGENTQANENTQASAVPAHLRERQVRPVSPFGDEHSIASTRRESGGVDYYHVSAPHSAGSGTFADVANATLSLVTLSHQPSVRLAPPRSPRSPQEDPFQEPAEEATAEETQEQADHRLSTALSIATSVESVPEVSLARKATVSHVSGMEGRAGRASVMTWHRSPVVTPIMSPGSSYPFPTTTRSPYDSPLASPTGPKHPPADRPYA